MPLYLDGAINVSLFSELFHGFKHPETLQSMHLRYITKRLQANKQFCFFSSKINRIKHNKKQQNN